ncbi:MAG: hypothetical protein ABI327_08670 [Burkholderiaceae bacterium]
MRHTLRQSDYRNRLGIEPTRVEQQRGLIEPFSLAMEKVSSSARPPGVPDRTSLGLVDSRLRVD